MKFSIITATYNSEALIFTAISSLKQQDYEHIEWIIIDGASKDATLSNIKINYSGELKIVSEKDEGIYDALNKGIQRATGDIIGFLHSDDLFASSHIIYQLAKVFKQKNADGVYGDLQYVDKRDTSKVIRHWTSDPFKPELLKQGWMPAHPTLFLKKEVYHKHGLFNLNFKIAADYDFMLRVFQDTALKFSYLPQVITKMRVGGTSNRSLKNILLKTNEDYRAVTLNKVGGIYTVLRKNTSKIKQFF